MREEFGIREPRIENRDSEFGIRESRNGRRARASVRRDRSAVSSVVGFILSFALSALILIVSMFSFTSMQESVYARAAEIELKDFGNRVVAGISESIEVRRNFPNATYSRTISLPAEIKGHQYYVEATGDRVYVNSTDGKIRIASTTYKASAENVFIFGRIYSSSMYLIVSMDAGRVEIRGG